MYDCVCLGRACKWIFIFQQPRKMLLEQLNSVLSSDEALPDSLILVNASEWQGQVRCVLIG